MNMADLDMECEVLLADLEASVKALAAGRKPESCKPGPRLQDILSDERPTWLIAARYGLDLTSLEEQLAEAMEIERRLREGKDKMVSGSGKFAEQLRLGEQVHLDLQNGLTWDDIVWYERKPRCVLARHANRYQEVVDAMHNNIASAYARLDKGVKWVPGWNRRRDATYTPDQLAELYDPPYNWSIEKIATETGWHYRKVREHLRISGAYDRKHGRPVGNLQK